MENKKFQNNINEYHNLKDQKISLVDNLIDTGETFGKIKNLLYNIGAKDVKLDIFILRRNNGKY